MRVDVKCFLIVLVSMSFTACSAAPADPTVKASGFTYSGEMIHIPAGSFLIGNSNVGDDAAQREPEELPRHSVHLPGYYIGKYEVTRGEYRAFIDAGGYSNSAYWSSDGWHWRESNSRTEPDHWAAQQNWATGEFTQTDKHPVVGVSYYEAEAFCKWAGGHLPTQAQWEKAARWTGSSANVYPWGNTWDVEKCNNYLDKNPAGGYGMYRTTPVGSYPSGASPYGCQDMAGNVREWCQDWYESYPESTRPFDHTNSYRVLRGGSWYYNPGGDRVNHCRCAYRGSSRLPYGSRYDYGFRMTRSAAAAPTDAVKLPAGAKAIQGRAETEMSQAGVSRGRVIYNLDCSEYFVGTFGAVVPETIDAFVDDHAAVGVTDLFININAQRTNYRSDVWESYWDGYDPTAGNNQPFFAGIDPQRMFETVFYVNTYLLHKEGCDYPQRMIDRCRYDRVSPWISLRMNDSHNPGLEDHPGHSTFWESHPEWRLSNGALDYEQPEVRELQMKLVKEVCARYDIDGLELDYQRFWLYFRPGREHDGAKLMAAFVREARQATDQAAKRLGHPVKLAVRMPSTPWIARRHGLDAVAWAKEGLVDLVIAASFWHSTNSDIPIETWKGLLIGTGCEVAVGLEDAANSGASGRRTMTHEEMRGILISGLHRGADAVYFFNLFTGPYHFWSREDHDRLLRDAGSYQTLQGGSRRHLLTIIDPWSIGEPRRSAELPYTGRHGLFRLHIGPKPLPGQKARIELVVPDREEPLEVRLNGIVCPWSGLVEPEHIKASGWKEPQPQRQLYDAPAEAASEGYNLIEVISKEDVTITWAEISVR